MARRTYSYSTGQDIRNEHLRLVGDAAETNIELLSEESVLFELNSLQRQVAQMPFSGLAVGPYFIPGTERRWDFLEDEREYSILADTALAANLSAGSTGNIALDDATGWDTASGAFVTYDDDGTWDYITFTTRTDGSNTLQGLGDVGLGNADGDAASKLYKLPSDFDEIISLHVPSVSDKPYSETAGKPGAREYRIIHGFLWFVKEHGAATATMSYQKRLTDLASITGSMQTPKELDKFYVEMLNARAYIANGNPERDVVRAYQNARNHFLSFLGFAMHSPNRAVQTVRGPFRSPTQ